MMFVQKTLFRWLLVGLFLCCGGAAAWAQTITSGAITQNTTWTAAKSPYVLDGDVTVNKGVTLTIEAGATINAATTDKLKTGGDTNKVELLVDGTLNVNGTSSTAVLFQGNNQKSGDWFGIRVRTGGKAKVDFATIRHAIVGLHNSGTTTVTSTDVTLASDSGLASVAGSLKVTSVHLFKNFNGVTSSGGTFEISKSVLYRNEKGILIKDLDAGHTNLIDHNTITNQVSYGVEIDPKSTTSPGKVTVENNIIAMNAGPTTFGFEMAATKNFSITCSHNVMWDNSVTAQPLLRLTCQNIINNNPLFADAANDDYELVDLSPARKSDKAGNDTGALPYTNKKSTMLHGVLWANRTVGPGVLRLSGDLLVRKGVTLTIAPGTILLVSNGDDMVAGTSLTKAELVVEGTIIAKGTSSQQVKIQAATATPGIWRGIVLATGANATFQHALLQHAETCLRTEGTALVEDTEVSRCSAIGVAAGGGSSTIRRAHFQGNAIGIESTAGTLDVSYSLLYRNSADAIHVKTLPAGHKVTLSHNTIANNNKVGVHVSPTPNSFGSMAIENNIIVENNTSQAFGHELVSDSNSPKVTCANNLIWDISGQTINRVNCTDTVAYNPLFVDKDNDNYKIYDRSPARKASKTGTDLGALAWTTDIDTRLHGLLVSDLTLPAGNHTLAGDLTIPKGVTLRIQQGAVIKVSDKDDMVGGADSKKSEFVVEGTLVSQGAPGKLVQISASNSQSGAWTGIIGKAGATLTLKQTSIQHADNGIDSSGTADLQDVEIARSKTQGLIARLGTVKVLRGFIHRNGRYGIEQLKSKLEVTYSRIARNANHGIHAGKVETGTTVLLDHNTIHQNFDYGILVTPTAQSLGTVTITNNIVTEQGRAANFFSDEIGITLSYVGVTCNNNLLWNKDNRYNRGSANLCTKTVQKDPLYQNEGNDDYALKSGSPAKGKATDSSDLGAISTQPVLAQILISPNPATAEVGDKVQLSAQGINTVGKAMTGLTFTWKIIKGGGTISASGQLTAGNTPGTYTQTIEASSGNVKGLADLIVTAPKIDKINITPAQITLAPGGSQSFQASAVDGAGSPIAGVKFDWTLPSGGGTLSPSGPQTQVSFAAGTQEGSFTLVAKAQNVQATATITIKKGNAGELARIEVTPAQGSVQVNGTLAFKAQGYDGANQPMAATVTWAVSGGGTISTDGTFTAGSTPGTFTVTAVSGTVSGTAQVTVQKDNTGGTLTRIEIQPAQATVKVGKTFQFAAQGFDAADTPIPVTVTWAASGGGTTSQTGLFTAGNTAGAFVVTASSNGVAGTANIEVSSATGNLPPAAPVLVSPAEGESVSGDVTLKITNAQDPDGDALTYHFRVSPDKGFESDVKQNQDVPEGTNETVWQPLGLQGGTTYYWQVRAHDGTIFGPWSKIQKFSLKGGQEPTTPSPDGAQGTPDAGAGSDTPGSSGGCGCSASTPGAGLFWSLFALFALLGIRRRTRHQEIS